MLIHPISFGALENFSNTLSKAPDSVNTKPIDKSEKKEKLMKALPYIAGAVVLATTAVVFRNRISKILKRPKIKEQPIQPSQTQKIEKTVEPNKKEVITALPAVIYKFDFSPKKVESVYIHDNVVQASKIEPKSEAVEKLNQKQNEIKKNVKESAFVKPKESEPEEGYKIMCIGFQDGKPVYAKVEMPIKGANETEDAFKDALHTSKLNDKAIVSKILTVRKAQEADIERIINENTHNGLIDIPMMQKIANDYMADINRGPDRFHQAADLLETSHLRQHIKSERRIESEMFNLVDYMTADSVLYKSYLNMPIEESANRLNLIVESSFKDDKFKDALETTDFFGKVFRKLVEKYQFKRHNIAHGIAE